MPRWTRHSCILYQEAATRGVRTAVRFIIRLTGLDWQAAHLMNVHKYLHTKDLTFLKVNLVLQIPHLRTVFST